MFVFAHDKYERRIFIKYIVVSLLSFLILASVNFGLIAHTLEPVDIILPVIIGIVVGGLLANNKVLQMRLVRSNNTKSQFLSSMNHELRTPMNAIVGFANLLQDSDNLTRAQKDEVGYIIHAGNHTIGIITELLDFAKIETGKIHLAPIELQADHVMLASVNMVRNLAEQSGIRIEHEMGDAQTATIMADEVRLTEVFVNILSNAIKYNKPCGTIHIGYRQEKGKLVVDIRDSGIGIDKAQLPYLFEPFNRMGAEKTGVEGTGVGLSITHALVEMMNGDIACESEFDKGTRFTLRFPLVQSKHPT